MQCFTHALLHRFYTLWVLYSHILHCIWPCWALFSKNISSRLRRRSWSKTLWGLSVTDWTRRSYLMSNLKSIAFSPRFFLFPRLAPPLHPEHSRHFLCCDSSLPGNSLFKKKNIPFLSDTTEWTTPCDLLWICTVIILRVGGRSLNICSSQIRNWVDHNPHFYSATSWNWSPWYRDTHKDQT